MNSTAILPTNIDQETPSHGGRSGSVTNLSRRLLILATFPLFISTTIAAIPVLEDPGNIAPGVIDLITDTEFGMQIVASGNPTSYGATGLPSDLSLDTQTGYISGEIDGNSGAGPATSNTVTFSATNADGTGTFPATFNVYVREPDLPTFLPPTPQPDQNIESALDVNPSGSGIIPFTQSPHNTLIGLKQDFFYRVTGIGEGGDAVRNNSTGPWTTSGVRAYVMGPSIISFTWWGNIENSSSGGGYDFFSFYVDEDPIPNPTSGFSQASHHPTDFITGYSVPSSPTAEFSKVLGPGLHRLEWLYTKDYNDAAGGGNRVFLDNVRVTGYPEWADDKDDLTAFDSGLAIDKERDGIHLLMEYAFDLKPDKKNDPIMPLMTFAPDGRAMLEVGGINDEAYGITVDIEKSTLLTPGSWTTSLLDNGSSSSVLKRIEASPQTDAYYRVNVTSP